MVRHLTGTKKQTSSWSAYGAAGGISAITAHDAGANVLLIEKMPHPGGISILSGGGVAFAHNAEGAFQYLKRTCNGTTPTIFCVRWPRRWSG